MGHCAPHPKLKKRRKCASDDAAAMVWTYQHKYLCQVGVADLVLANLCSVADKGEKCVEADTFVDSGITKYYSHTVVRRQRAVPPNCVGAPGLGEHLGALRHRQHGATTVSGSAGRR
jgi:hypothetical protein